MSDTDYRQFVKYGNVTGFDMAYFQNSYVYHSSLDVYETIEFGSIQHLGQPSLEIVSFLMASDMIDEPDFFAPKKIVYFDLFGLFLVRYPWEMAVVGNVILHLWTALHLWRFVGARKDVVVAITQVAVLMGITYAICLLAPALLGAFLSYNLDQRLYWFRREYLPMFYFSPIAIAVSLFIHSRREKSLIGARASHEIYSLLGYLLVLNAALALSTLGGVLTSYFFSIWVFHLNLGLQFTPLTPGKGTGTVHWATYAVGFTFPLMYTADMAALLLDFLVPLTARLGYGTPVDVVMGLLCGHFTFFTVSLVLPLAQRFRSVKRLAVLMLVATAVIPILFAFFSPPFDHLHPKRVYLQHHYDLDHNEAYLLAGATEYGKMAVIPETLAMYATTPGQIESPTPAHQTYWESLYPVGYFIGSYKIPVPQPKLASGENLERLHLTAMSKTDAPAGLRNLTLVCDHPGYPWTVLMFRADVVAWSIPDLQPEPQEEEKKYIIRQVAGYGHHRWTLDLSLREAGPVEFRMLGLVHEDSTLTLDAIKEFPDWVDPTIRMVVIEQRFTL